MTRSQQQSNQRRFMNRWQSSGGKIELPPIPWDAGYTGHAIDNPKGEFWYYFGGDAPYWLNTVVINGVKHVFPVYGSWAYNTGTPNGIYKDLSKAESAGMYLYTDSSGSQYLAQLYKIAENVRIKSNMQKDFTLPTSRDVVIEYYNDNGSEATSVYETIQKAGATAQYFKDITLRQIFPVYDVYFIWIDGAPTHYDDTLKNWFTKRINALLPSKIWVPDGIDTSEFHANGLLQSRSALTQRMSMFEQYSSGYPNYFGCAGYANKGTNPAQTAYINSKYVYRVRPERFPMVSVGTTRYTSYSMPSGLCYEGGGISYSNKNFSGICKVFYVLKQLWPSNRSMNEVFL